ncbi:MAG TPA: SGNH/GDSL hydrolase family protein [bacterium]|nr:SGNH/GDSL hydrolase family protein [bacterium]
MKKSRLTLFSSAVFIAAAVIVFSVFSLFADRPAPGPADTPGFYRAAAIPGVAHEHVPGMTGHLNGVAARINEQGWRGGGIEMPKPAGNVRIVVTGDSVVFGQGVEENSTLAVQLEKKIEALAPAKKWETINAGVRGYNIKDYALIFKPRVLALDPDLVVLVITEINDPERVPFIPHSPKMDRWKRAWWTRLPFIRPLLALPVAEEMGRLLTAHVRGLYDPAGPEWPAFLKELTDIVNASREAHVAIIVVTFPYLDDADVFHDERARLQRALTELGVPWIDPRPELARHASSALVVSRNDFHPNALALGITAGLLAGTVVREFIQQ